MEYVQIVEAACEEEHEEKKEELDMRRLGPGRGTRTEL